MQQFKLPSRTLKKEKKAFINARIIDPETKLDIKGTLITEGNKIADFGENLLSSGIPEGIEVVNCNGNILCPGLIDIQVHFRYPGQEQKETIGTGSKSAAAGGITTVVCQPNTKPTIDSPEVIKMLKAKEKEEGYINIETYACITKGMKGEELADLAALKEAGAVGFTDDGLPVMSAHLMRLAFEASEKLGRPIVQHAEDLNLSNKGCITEGEVSKKLCVRGIPNLSESLIVARDIRLLEKYGGSYHVLHVSTKEAVEEIRMAKKKGLKITAEAAPHHFALTEAAVLEHGTNAKMNPPLRSEADRLAIIEALKDGTIEAIATDHAPHDPASKALPLPEATFGIVGVETMLPIALELYHNKTLSLIDLLAKMTYKAADIVHLKRGRLKKDTVADLTLIDINQEWKIDTNQFHSKSKNSPFNGRNVKGRAIKTVLAGEIVYSL